MDLKLLQKRSLQKKLAGVSLVALATWLIIAGYDRVVFSFGSYGLSASGLLYLFSVLMLAIPTRTIYYIGQRIGDGIGRRIGGPGGYYEDFMQTKNEVQNNEQKESE